MHLVRWAVLAACSLAVSSSIAAPFPAPSGNAATAHVARADTIDAYQAYSQKEKCEIKGFCTLTFPAVTNSQVLIQHVSCAFEIKTGVAIVFTQLNIDGPLKEFNAIAANKNINLADGDFYTINAQTYLFVPEGQHPEVTVEAAMQKNPEGLRCTISGQHVENIE